LYFLSLNPLAVVFASLPCRLPVNPGDDFFFLISLSLTHVLLLLRDQTELITIRTQHLTVTNCHHHDAEPGYQAAAGNYWFARDEHLVSIHTT
jgi:hypothetical protein